MTIRGSSAVGGPAASAEQACGARLLFGLCLLAAVLATGCASQPSVTDASRRPAKTIADFWAIDTPETVAVVMKSDRPLTYTATRQENPRGVFLQFPDTGLDGMHSVYYPPPNPVLRSIRTAEGAGGSEARVLLELAQDAPYEVVPDSEGLKIVFQKPFAAAAFGGMPAISGTAAAPAKPAGPACPEGYKMNGKVGKKGDFSCTAGKGAKKPEKVMDCADGLEYFQTKTTLGCRKAR